MSIKGQVNINYGNTTNAFSSSNRSNYTIGQPLAGRANGLTYVSEYGFWPRFLLPPQAPSLQASQGEYDDRIHFAKLYTTKYAENTEPIRSRLR